MVEGKFNKIIRFIPPLVWMSLIFIASSQQKVGMGGNFWVSFIIFKTIHVLEYGALYTFWRLALYKENYANTASILISAVYGMSDELHQTFVPTREGTVRDVIIDFLGILLFSKLFMNVIIPQLKKINFIKNIYGID